MLNFFVSFQSVLCLFEFPVYFCFLCQTPQALANSDNSNIQKYIKQTIRTYIYLNQLHLSGQRMEDLEDTLGRSLARKRVSRFLFLELVSLFPCLHSLTGSTGQGKPWSMMGMASASACHVRQLHTFARFELCCFVFVLFDLLFSASFGFYFCFHFGFGFGLETLTAPFFPMSFVTVKGPGRKLSLPTDLKTDLGTVGEKPAVPSFRLIHFTSLFVLLFCKYTFAFVLFMFLTSNSFFFTRSVNLNTHFFHSTSSS